MAYAMHDRVGEAFDEPDEARIREILAELGNADADEEHPDVSLKHESGWALSFFPDKFVRWENGEPDRPRPEPLHATLLLGRHHRIAPSYHHDGHVTRLTSHPDRQFASFAQTSVEDWTNSPILWSPNGQQGNAEAALMLNSVREQVSVARESRSVVLFRSCPCTHRAAR